MITWELIVALSVYYVIMFATPGPNNSILTASGIKFGFVRTIPNILGVPSGHAIQLTLVCLGLGGLFAQFPILLNVLKYAGAVYLLYLAWKMLGSLKVSNAEDKVLPLNIMRQFYFNLLIPKHGLSALPLFRYFTLKKST